jgi:hypothetical protein
MHVVQAAPAAPGSPAKESKASPVPPGTPDAHPSIDAQQQPQEQTPASTLRHEEHASAAGATHAPAAVRVPARRDAPGNEGTDRHGGNGAQHSRRHHGPESFVDSPVTNVRVAGSGEVSDESMLEVTGPGNFQAIREIGQGAFGKVSLQLVPTHCASRPKQRLPPCLRQLHMHAAHSW